VPVNGWVLPFVQLASVAALTAAKVPALIHTACTHLLVCMSAVTRRDTKEGEEASGSARTTHSNNSSACASPVGARASPHHAHFDNKALWQHLAHVPASQGSPIAARPLGEGAEDEVSMFEYHGRQSPDVSSPVTREGSAFSHTSLRDWHTKAGRTESGISRSRSSASLWHCEYAKSHKHNITAAGFGVGRKHACSCRQQGMTRLQLHGDACPETA
jgi:hypothetical protein